MRLKINNTLYSDHQLAMTGTGENLSLSCCSSPSCIWDFSFAYNNSRLSDRVLHIEIIDPSSSNSSADSECTDADADWPQNWKRRRIDNQKENGEHSPEGAHSNDSNRSKVPSRVVRVETVHISSAILAARSPFFRKLFLNEMVETQQRHATLQISSSEEAAVTELLKFMYGKSLSSTSAPAVLDVLMVADKYEVCSCMWSCCQLLQNLPMSPESALLYLELPSSLSMTTPILDLTKLAKQFLIDRYKDMKKPYKEMMKLPLVGIEAILSSDDLRVPSEDTVYEFVLAWAWFHYKQLEERRDILATRLIHLVRFPYMSCHCLRKILTYSDIDVDYEFLLKLVLEALFFKSETPYRKSILATEQSSNTGRGFVERSYTFRPIKLVELLLPRQQTVVYFDVKRKEYIDLLPAGSTRSEPFALARQSFYLSSGCVKNQQTSNLSFRMGIGMLKEGLPSVQVDYQFALRSKLTRDYIVKHNRSLEIIRGGRLIRYRGLFTMPWSSITQEDDGYFINGILYLRAVVTITG